MGARLTLYFFHSIIPVTVNYFVGQSHVKCGPRAARVLYAVCVCVCVCVE